MFGRKIAVIAASLMLTLSMSAVAFANQEAPTTTNANPANGSSIVIEKDLKVVNPTLSSVDGPGASFAYAVAPVAPAVGNGGTTITDSEGHVGTVHQGPADGVTITNGTIAYPVGTAVEASSAGADNKKTITATADVTKFSAPGIYRYEVTETATLGDCEVTNTANQKRYIDVYVTNGANDLQVAGMVMHDGTTASGAPAQKKTFDDARFETVNITLKKTVSGNMADKRNQFPFTATTSDHGRYHYSKKAEAPSAAADNPKAEGTESTTLADTEMYYISGLSKAAAVAYEETNNTQDVYQTSITGGTPSEASAVAAEAKKAMDATDVDNAAAVVFNNDLQEVSPTGVIMRFGPYIGMVLAALVFALIFRRTRQSNNA